MYSCYWIGAGYRQSGHSFVVYAGGCAMNRMNAVGIVLIMLVILSKLDASSPDLNLTNISTCVYIYSKSEHICLWSQCTGAYTY